MERLQPLMPNKCPRCLFIPVGDTESAILGQRDGSTWAKSPHILRCLILLQQNRAWCTIGTEDDRVLLDVLFKKHVPLLDHRQCFRRLTFAPHMNDSFSHLYSCVFSVPTFATSDPVHVLNRRQPWLPTLLDSWTNGRVRVPQSCSDFLRVRITVRSRSEQSLYGLAQRYVAFPSDDRSQLLQQ